MVLQANDAEETNATKKQRHRAKWLQRLVLTHIKHTTDPLLDPLQFAYRSGDDPAPGSCLWTSALLHTCPAERVWRHLQEESRLPDRQMTVCEAEEEACLQTIGTTLVSWCSTNNLSGHDWAGHCSSTPWDSPAAPVGFLRFLGTTITQELKREQSISFLLRGSALPQADEAAAPPPPCQNAGELESILTSSITVWYCAASAGDRAKVISCSLPSLQEPPPSSIVAIQRFQSAHQFLPHNPAHRPVQILHAHNLFLFFCIWYLVYFVL